MTEATSPVIPPRGRLLGLDYGQVRIGIAVCDADRTLASPLETYTRQNPARDEAFFRTLVTREGAVGLVVGLPLHINGQSGSKAAECRAFADWLVKIVGLPVAFADERFTTVVAEDALWNAGLTHKKRKSRRDQVAAQLILQSYLDVGGNTAYLDEPPSP